MIPIIRTLYLDPPWNERGGGKIPRGAQHKYDLIKKKHDIGDDAIKRTKEGECKR